MYCEFFKIVNASHVNLVQFEINSLISTMLNPAIKILVSLLLCNCIQFGLKTCIESAAT